MRNEQLGKSQKKDKPVFPFYPILVGVYPVLALAAYNIAQIDFSATFRSIVISLLLAAALFGILKLILRDGSRAAFLTTLLLLLFFTYGHVYSLLKAAPLGRHRLLLLIWAVLAALAVLISTRRSLNFHSITLVLNIAAGIVLIFPSFQIVQSEARNRPVGATTVASAASSRTYPDIYYIILDGYMRADNLQAVYDFDNTAFIDDLTSRGFYIANCSQSNYAYTQLSLASSLNANYLDKLGVFNGAEADAAIQDSSIRLFFENRGYTIVAFDSGFSWTQWENANVYYKYKPHSNQLNGFEALLLQTTLFRAPMDIFNLNKSISSDALDYDRMIANLNLLKKVPLGVKGPKFVFAHLVIPHPPYIYTSKGDFTPQGPLAQEFLYDLTTPAPDKPGYPNAVLFINGAILQVIDHILADSTTPPVIIVQGDHGAFRFISPEQRMSILNAYYFPNAEAKASLYPSITPVNTFRILFDAYFGQNYPLLADVSRYSPLDEAWSFTTVQNDCK